MPVPPKGIKQRRLTYTRQHNYPGVINHSHVIGFDLRPMGVNLAV